MAKLTITEALAETKTIAKRIAAKKEAVMRYFARLTGAPDPLEKDGGSVEHVRRERQAIKDLEERLVAIRCAIQMSNLTEIMVIDGMTRSVAAWLNWRREVSAGQLAFYNTMLNTVNTWRQPTREGGKAMMRTPAGQVTELPEPIFSVNEKDLAAEAEALTKLLGDLDGRLSLANATTTIDL